MGLSLILSEKSVLRPQRDLLHMDQKHVLCLRYVPVWCFRRLKRQQRRTIEPSCLVGMVIECRSALADQHWTVRDHFWTKFCHHLLGPNVIANPYDCCSSVEQKISFEKCLSCSGLRTITGVTKICSKNVLLTFPLNELVTLYFKTAHIEGSLPKRQLVECSILWCNNVAKHHLHRRRLTCFYICFSTPPTDSTSLLV